MTANGSPYKTFNLSREIDPQKSSCNYLPKKVEIKLAKTVAAQWTCLEGPDPIASFKLPGNDLWLMDSKPFKPTIASWPSYLCLISRSLFRPNIYANESRCLHLYSLSKYASALVSERDCFHWVANT